MAVFVVELNLPGNAGKGYLAPVTHAGRPTYTAQLSRAARFASTRQAADASRHVPPALDPVVMQISDEEGTP